MIVPNKRGRKKKICEDIRSEEEKLMNEIISRTLLPACHYVDADKPEKICVEFGPALKKKGSAPLEHQARRDRRLCAPTAGNSFHRSVVQRQKYFS